MNCNKLYRSSPLITLLFVLLLSLFFSANIQWGSDKQHLGILEADARGYYSWLPAIFIYHDLNFSFTSKIEGEKYDSAFYYEYRTGSISGKIINKYYVGTAVMQLPFFLIAHWTADILGYDKDGYSKPYFILINLAGIFYLILGLFFFRKVLELYNIRSGNISLVLLTITFSTNLLYYAAVEPGASHIYSFALFIAFILLIKQLLTGFKFSLLILASISFGLICLIRPVNAMIIFAIPFLAYDSDQLKKLITDSFLKFRWVMVIILVVLIGSIQLVLYKVSTDHWFVYSYGSEGFNFLTPHITDFLISYRKGLFMYTPIAILLFILGFSIYKRDRYHLFTFFSFWIITIYVLSSWWNWWYGGSYSVRVLLEYLPVLFIPLAIFLNSETNSLRRYSVIAMMIASVIFCQLQIYQYRHLLIHWSDMTYEKYWELFLKFSVLF